MWHLKVCAGVLVGIMIGVTLLPFTGQGSGMLAILQGAVPDSALHESIGFMDLIYTEFSRNTINEARLYFFKEFCTLPKSVYQFGKLCRQWHYYLLLEVLVQHTGITLPL